MFGRATSAPLFWMASAGFAAAWYLQRKTAENQVNPAVDGAKLRTCCSINRSDAFGRG
ncbi:hypothetical protein ACIGBH_38570 [Streptomyces sp. NPDC085929]